MIREAPPLKRRKNAVEGGLKRIQERPEDKPARHQHKDPQRKHAHAVVNRQRIVRKKVAQNAAPVQRRKRNQVEHKQEQVDQDNEVKQQRNRKQRRQVFGRHARIVHRQRHRRKHRNRPARHHMLDHQQQDQRDRRQQKIARRPRQRYQDVVPLVVLKIARRHRSRLRPPDQRPVIHQRNQRHQHRPEGIQVLHRIQRHPPEHPRRRITQPPRRPGMRTLMHAERKNQRHNLEKDQNNILTHDDSSLPERLPIRIAPASSRSSPSPESPPQRSPEALAWSPAP